MKKIKLFEEVDLRGNPGIPGEPNKKSGESNFMDDSAREAKRKLNINDRDIHRPGQRPPKAVMEHGMKLMMLSVEVQKRFIKGYEKKLEDLARKLFEDQYSELMDRYDIELDLKIGKPSIKKGRGGDESPEMNRFTKIIDEETIRQIHKRKIANLIIQGEAKNTKHMLHLPECKDGLIEIYGETLGKKAFEMFDEITKLADKLDWLIDPEVRADMIQMDKNDDFAAGSCEVKWVKKVDEDEDEDEEPDFDLSSYDEDEDEDEDSEPEYEFRPIIKARGIDFPMLLHESVKGLFEILSLGGIPEDKEMATKVLSNTGLSDEPQDWQYGPIVAAKLRDFVNKNPNIDKYPNVREELFKLMVDKETMPSYKFLELMRGILSNTPQARRDVDILISKVISNLDDFNDAMRKYKMEIDEYEREKDNFTRYTKQDDPEELDELDNIFGSKTKSNDLPTKEIEDYSKYSQRQLQDMIDDALDNEDYEKVDILSKYIKESRYIKNNRSFKRW